MKELAFLGSFVISALFFVAFFLTFVKFFNECKSKPYIEKLRAENKETEKTPYLKIILFSVSVRVVMMLAGIIICLIFESDAAFNMEKFSSLWLKWDGPHYINIAKVGYNFLEDGENILLVFFPLYSYLLRIVNFVIGNYYVSGLLVSWVSYVLAMIYLYKLTVLEFSESTAFKTIFLISVFPFSFFFGSIHTESISLLMMVISFYYIRKHNWKLACIFGILASLSRMVGSLVIVAAVIEYIITYKPHIDLKEKNYKKLVYDFGTKFIFIALISLGGLIYLAINYYISGDPFDFLVHQERVWNNKTQFMPVTIYKLFVQTFTTFNTVTGCISIPEILLLLIVSIFMLLRWKRISSTYGIFLGLYMLMSYAASNLLSAGRYISIAFPFFMLLSDWTEEKEMRFSVTLSLSCVFLGIYVTGFLLYKYIM